jgi:hypothetical protein
MSLARNIRTSAHERGFVEDALTEARRIDLALMMAVPVVLLAVYSLPRSTLEGFAFDTTSPTLVGAYASHFVHLQGFHLLGNLTVYVPVVGVAYLLCILSGRRQLFRISFVTLLVAFPIALSSMQIIFPRPRLIFGFSGINAGFAGMACFVYTGYLQRNITPRADERYAPTVLFVAMGLIALLALPAEAFRLEIGAASLALAAIYVGVALYRQGIPSTDDIREAVDRPGYFETAGAGLGLIVGYPFVAFQDAVVPESGVVDVYVHLLGASLAFIVLFAYVFVIRSEEGS